MYGLAALCHEPFAARSQREAPKFFRLCRVSERSPRLHFPQPPLQKATLAVIGDQRQRSRRSFRPLLPIDPMRRSRSARAECSR